MKNFFFRKILALTLLFAFVFFAPRAKAQEVELLPNASKVSDYQVETTPYKGQGYQIQAAGITDIDDVIRDWLIRNTLGKVVNNVFGFTKENMMKWSGDLIHFVIVNLYTLLTGPEGLHGSGSCTPTENNCWDDPETPEPEYIPQIVGDEGYCECVPNPDFITYNPARHGLVGVTGALTMNALRQGPPNMQVAQFIKNELADNILSRPAYAQTGVTYFDPVVAIARVFRNIAYLFMVIILIIMGFMIMLRRQVDPRAVMTITNALPRVATSLILITFSYPIAGLLVDIGRLLKKLIDGLFGGFMTMHNIEPFQLVVDLFGNFIGVSALDPRFWLGLKGNINLGGTGVFALALEVGMAVIAIVVAFMLFFTLVFRFAGLFMQVVFAPLAFAWGALPGQEDTISRWFRSFAVNVLTFPVIYLLVNLSNYIAVTSTSKPLPMPEDLGWGTIFNVIGGKTNLGGLVAFGLLVAATRVPAMLEDAFAVTPPAAVVKAGVEPGKILGRLPVVGKIFK